jgi:hypothetical protein
MRISGYKGNAADGMRSSRGSLGSAPCGYRGATTSASWPCARNSETMRRTTVVTPLTCGVYVSDTNPMRTPARCLRAVKRV